MEKIKFRSFDTEIGIFFYSDKEYDDHFFEFSNGILKCYGIRENPGSNEEPPFPESYECEPVNQFTGLLDINGKGNEIYHKDLFDIGKIGIIEWIKDGWFVKFSDYEVRLSDFLETDETRKIIGNIYENPDL